MVCPFHFPIQARLTRGPYFFLLPNQINMKTMPNNTGKVNNRYAKSIGGTTVTLNFRTAEATALRAFVQSFRLRGNKIPSLSLIARRAMSVYLAHAQYSQETKASEIAALEKLATPFSSRTPAVAPEGSPLTEDTAT